MAVVVVQVGKAVNPGRLSDELVAAGVRVVTVRGSKGGPSEVVVEAQADASKVAAVVAAHDASDRERATIEAVIAVLTDPGSAPATWRDAATAILTRMARRLIAERRDA